MFQKIFTSYYLTFLRDNLPDNLSLYETDTMWVPEMAGDSNYALDSRIRVDDSFKLKLPQNDNLFDLENSKLLFEALRGLSRSQAADSRLWTYMTHISCWEYMSSRWSPSEKYKNLPPEKRGKKLQTYVLEHYFVRSDQSRALIRNGIARLWWYSFLTYDSNRENPYELTAVLLKKLDIAKNVVERNLGRNKTVLHSVLEFLLDKPDLIDGGDAGRTKIRKLIQSLNLHGGFCILDDLSRQEIKSFLQKRYNEIINGNTPEIYDLQDEDDYDETD